MNDKYNGKRKKTHKRERDRSKFPESERKQEVMGSCSLYSYMSKFLERCSKIDRLKAEIKPLSLTPHPHNWHIQYLNEAVECFHKNLPISCIVVSSALVEACLCWEHWRRKPEEKRKTIPLNEFRHDTMGILFREFVDSDIPLDKLLDSDEKDKLGRLGKKEKEDYISTVRYVMTRNKFSHGDLFYSIYLPATLLSGHEKDWLDYGIDNWLKADLETVAYVHLLKTLRFIKGLTDFLIEKEKMRNK